MEQFATEEQQVEAIKRFWKENGMAIVVGAVVGLGGLWGWRYYNQSQIDSKEAASASYQQAMEQLAQGQDAQALALAKEQGDAGYTLLLTLQLAQQAVESNDLESAASQLKFAADSAPDANLQSIAKLRLARVQLALEDASAALSTVQSITGDAFSAQSEEIKGDAYVQQGDFDKARLAYGQALEANANNSLLKMKLDNLSVAADA